MLCASEFRINDNAAQEGAAIYSDANCSLYGALGGFVYLNRKGYADCANPEPRGALGAMAYAAGVPVQRVRRQHERRQWWQSHRQLRAPTFVDAAKADYHLMRNSCGVNDAPIPASVRTLDLDGRTRVVDLPDIENNFGPMNLGAYEIQPARAGNDRIFCNGFDGQWLKAGDCPLKFTDRVRFIAAP